MIELKPVTQFNYLNVAYLKLNPEQEPFIAPNWLSLLEANYENDKYPFAVYHDGEVVGFLMCSYYPADKAYLIDSWWLERLMIDKVWQGRGLGRESLKLFLNTMKPSAEVSEIRVGVEPGNERAKTFFESFGFVKEGLVENENVYFRRW